MWLVLFSYLYLKKVFKRLINIFIWHTRLVALFKNIIIILHACWDYTTSWSYYVVKEHLAIPGYHYIGLLGDFYIYIYTSISVLLSLCMTGVQWSQKSQLGRRTPTAVSGWRDNMSVLSFRVETKHLAWLKCRCLANVQVTVCLSGCVMLKKCKDIIT